MTTRDKLARFAAPLIVLAIVCLVLAAVAAPGLMAVLADNLN